MGELLSHFFEAEFIANIHWNLGRVPCKRFAHLDRYATIGHMVFAREFITRQCVLNTGRLCSIRILSVLKICSCSHIWGRVVVAT
jgi:hypothetical protein